MSKLGGLLGRPEGGPEAVSEDAREMLKAPEMIEGVLDTYRVPSNAGPDSSAEVFIVDEDGTGRYLVRPPPMSQAEEVALDELRKSLFESVPLEASLDPRKVVEDHIARMSERPEKDRVAKDSHDKLVYYLMREFTGFWEIDPLMADDSLEEISVSRYDRPVRVLHRSFSEYMFVETNVVYPTEERLQAFVRRLAQFGGTSISLAQPSLEVTLHGTSDRRITATLGDEISRPGSTYAIRKQKERPITISQLSAPEPARWARQVKRPPPSGAPYEEVPSHKTLSVLMAAYFWLLLERTTNVLIAGETNSGKTTLMNSILSLVNPKAKVVTAEDVLEINLPDHLHWQRLKTRSHRAGLSPSSSRYEYNLSDLLKLALRFSPTVLSLGEMRGEESETLAAAITLGFSTMTTIHAENAERCVQRLTTPPMRFTEGHIRDITAIATIRKVALSDGRVARRVVSVDEIKPVGQDSHEIVRVFRYEPPTDSFRPTTPAEVVDRSFRLNEIAESAAWTPASVQDSLSARAERIGKNIADGALTPESLSKMVKDFALQETRTLVFDG